jgi:hypothetical protein
MSGDFSRLGFDPWLDDLGVLLQQGRPLTDRDWNDQALQVNRRIQAGTLDTFGRAVVPMETPEGFEIQLNGGALTIGRGRIYVDGLLAENHGKAPAGGSLDWDPALAELFGAAALNYDEQPYYPDAPALPAAGKHMVYLDVWQREVTRFIRPDLVEKALGVDTTARLQTVWQVKLIKGNADTTCSTDLDAIEEWNPGHAPSAGRLSVTTVPVPGQPDPCQIPPAGGYKGLENQLYRVEIHEGGEPGAATFKWSRDNASVEAAVLEIPSLTQLVVDSVGKDSVLRFNDGDWIEITDDWLELHNKPGVIRRIANSNGVDAATQTITLASAMPASQFPTNPQDLTDPLRHTRIRRWDQKNAIVDASGTEIQDLNDAAADGTITVPAGGTQVLLEHNIVASFNVRPADGVFRSGDYWVFAARSVDASVEELKEAPPRGVHHHYAKLAVVTFPGSETDCRVFWPPTLSAPPSETPAEECACTVCVTPESHEGESLTIQDAIDQIRERGGGTICLDVGSYRLRQPLELTDVISLRIAGKGMQSRLLAETRAITISKSADVTLESFQVVCRPTSTAPDAAIAIASSKDLRIERLAISIANNQPAWAAIGLNGALAALSLRENTIAGATGIRAGDPSGGETGLTDLRVDDNAFECERTAVELIGITLHQFVSYIRGNRMTGCQEAAIVLAGASVAGHGVEVSGNALAVQGYGIVAGLDGLRVVGNDIVQAEVPPKQQAGVRLLPTAANEDGLDNIQIAGNTFTGFHGAGIESRVPRARSWRIADNRFNGGANGIVLQEPELYSAILIEGNQLREIGNAGIRAEGSAAELTVSGNHVETRGTDPAVFLVFGRGDTIFSDNHVSRRGGNESADVVLASRTLAVDANRVHASRLSMELKAGEAHFTVLGNICRGEILVNGSLLSGTPWDPLNRQNV